MKYLFVNGKAEKNENLKDAIRFAVAMNAVYDDYNDAFAFMSAFIDVMTGGKDKLYSNYAHIIAIDNDTFDKLKFEMCVEIFTDGGDDE